MGGDIVSGVVVLRFLLARGGGDVLLAELDVVVRQRLSGQLRQARRSVRLARVVRIGGVDEPLHGLRLASRRRKVVGVRVEQPGAPRLAVRRVQLRELQADDGGVELAEVTAGAGSDDRQLDRLGAAELSRFRASSQIDRTLGAAERPLDVRHDREVPGPATHPAGGAELPESFGPLAGVVRRDARSLSHGSDARCAVPRVAGVSEGLVGVVVDERAGRDEVPRDGLRGLLLQAPQVAAHVGVQLGGRHVVGKRRRRHPGLVGAPAVAALGPVARPAFARATGLGTAGAAVAVVATGRPVAPEPLAGAVGRAAVLARTGRSAVGTLVAREPRAPGAGTTALLRTVGTAPRIVAPVAGRVCVPRPTVVGAVRPRTVAAIIAARRVAVALAAVRSAVRAVRPPVPARPVAVGPVTCRAGALVTSAVATGAVVPAAGSVVPGTAVAGGAVARAEVRAPVTVGAVSARPRVVRVVPATRAFPICPVVGSPVAARSVTGAVAGAGFRTGTTTVAAAVLAAVRVPAGGVLIAAAISAVGGPVATPVVTVSAALVRASAGLAVVAPIPAAVTAVVRTGTAPRLWPPRYPRSSVR